MPDMFASVVTRQEKLDELDYELRMREQVYGRRVAEGKMTPERAERKITVLRAIRDDIDKWIAV